MIAESANWSKRNAVPMAMPAMLSFILTSHNSNWPLPNGVGVASGEESEDGSPVEAGAEDCEDDGGLWVEWGWRCATRMLR